MFRIMINKIKIVTLLVLPLLHSVAVDASNKKYPFKIDDHREVVISRSSTAGSKIVEVTAYGSSADKAIRKAMIDAVISLTFYGATGSKEMAQCPAILLDGRTSYDKNKNFFDHFFKKRLFLSYVKKVNSTYPTGQNNVKTPKGRRIKILLIVDWNGLAEYYQKAGLKTVTHGLSDY